jgi:hypothetical protein
MKHFIKRLRGNEPSPNSTQTKKSTLSPTLVLSLFLLLLNTPLLAQQKNISGTIIDVSGQPLPGANVLVKGTTTGTQSDFDGKYTIQASPKDVLIFSYLGYTAQSIIVGGRMPHFWTK